MSSTTQPAQKFGTFLGVYVPSVLTILGVMMYLRFGWVLGHTGLPLAMLIVLMASSITLITGLSASAIATNMKVGVGGEYYMVSRSLGLELGGAIGIPLFLCRVLSLTLYCFGLAETVMFLWRPEWGELPGWSMQAIAGVLVLGITAIAGKSAALTLKLQIPIMIAVGLSLVGLVIGVLSGDLHAPDTATHYERSRPPLEFWVIFAVYFPAVTGFTAGIGMSGDLKDPKRSIPRGTIAAVLTGLAVYLAIPVLLAITGRVTGDELANLDPAAPPIWVKVAPFGIVALGFLFVFPGMFGAILSSAFGSALGGPRVLQALASDGLMPRWLARTSKTGQPTIATWVAGGLALTAVLLGDLNQVGRWVTMFFLTLYVMINLSAALESLVGDPSYRPTIRVPWYLSLLGSAGAIAVMFLIHPLACACAVVSEMVLYAYLRRRALRGGWGDLRAGLWTALARFALLNLRQQPPQARNWRPQILTFTANPASRMGLVRMASWFNQDRGIVTVCQVIEEDPEGERADVDGMQREMQGALDDEGLTAFAEVHSVPQFESGVIGIAQANGFAGLQSNTVMFGWPGSRPGLAFVLRHMRAMTRIRKNSILAKLPMASGPREHRKIDVWWRGMQENGDLMLLLAHLLRLNPAWRGATITLRTIVGTEDERERMASTLDGMITEARIRAASDVIVKPPDRSVLDLIHEASDYADVVFFGLKVPEAGEEEDYAAALEEMAEPFETAVFVRSAGRFAGKLIESSDD